MPIAKEGIPIISGAVAVAAILGVIGWHMPAFAALTFAGLSTGFFRDPNRVIPGEDGLVVSPADGRVIAVDEKVEAPQLRGLASRISIFMSPLNVHVNRAPIAGRVRSVRYQPGKFHAAFSPKASPDNERNAILMADDRNEEFLIVQIAGAVARRIVCYVAPEARLDRGARCGLIMFGSRVDVYVPESVTVGVRPGDRLRAGESVIGAYAGECA